MNIILVSGRLAKARTITLDWPHLALLGCGLAAAFIALAGAVNYLALRLAADHALPLLHSIVLSAQHRQQERNESYLQENLNAMAVKLGEMQAQLMRLDTLGER